MMPSSSMLSLVQEYLDERRRLGFALTISGAQLMAFASFADRVGHHGPLTSEIIFAWAQGEATRATPITWARRLEIIRPFAKHRAKVDADTEVPGTDVFGRVHRRLTLGSRGETASDTIGSSIRPGREISTGRKTASPLETPSGAKRASLNHLKIRFAFIE